MELRSSTESDLEAVIAWIGNANDCLTWAGPDVIFPIIPNALKNQIGYTADNSFCLLDETSRVAFGQLIQKGENHYHLARIIVAPADRGQGYGRKICEYLIKMAHDHGSRLLTLNVYRDNQKAVRLYRHIGFNPAPPPDTMQLPADVIHMRWEKQ